MTHPSADASREKLLVNLTPDLRRDLRIRAAEHGLNMQDAAASAISLWLETPQAPEASVQGARSWGVFLPVGLPGRFTDACEQRGITKVQGMAQAITLWLSQYASPDQRLTEQPVQRVLVGNQKGGVGKTFVSSGFAQACAEAGKRVLLIDYDPQKHLSSRHQIEGIPEGGESLLRHMTGKAERHIARSLVALPHDRFGGRLHVLPADEDAFLMDAELAVMQIGRDRALINALAPIEQDYDVIVLDGPPNLGLAMDLAIHYVQRRPGELIERSGILIPVWSDKSSFKAYELLSRQIDTVERRTGAVVDQLGFVVNMYDSRKGTVMNAFYEGWQELTTPGTLATLRDLAPGREASDYEVPLLDYAPDSQHADVMRALAKELTA
ncbi:Sporulation initiation inhibitor protein Soj [Streptomyces sp. 111WW2]|jgi:chromosome partitioning protein|uniref:ParA family protein n=1 Tax=Streptomyces TaxID=1883 RepID=UPI000D0C80E4|nr:ParA family protein [Streptomyces sp. 111WW2]PSK57032.1 Sporulation initiation inhibitor protein Soj [Streptomyces sp. 111WW2]